MGWYSLSTPEAALLGIATAKALALSDEWEGNSGKAYISPENLLQTAVALQTAVSQSRNPAA